MTLVRLMKDKALRNRLWYTLFVLIVCATMTAIPVAGLNTTYLKEVFGDSSVLNYMDILSGGALSRMSMSGFGISSYISASIIMQLLAILFPSIEKIRQDGESGKRKMERIQFALAMLFTLIAACGMIYAYYTWDLFEEFTPLYVGLAVCSWMLGSCLTVFLAQSVEEKGIGNGISLVLCFNILGRLPNSFLDYYNNTIADAEFNSALIYGVGLGIGLTVFFLLAVYLQCGMLDIPIKQNKKAGSIMNTDGRLPMNVNIANVMPIVYASSLISIPQMVISICGISLGDTAQEVVNALTSANWYAPEHWYYLLGFGLYVILLIVFSYFSSETNYSVEEIANNMRKSGDVIPGVQPGRDTVNYLTKRRKVLTTVNLLFLLVIGIAPDFICARIGITSFSYLGTSLVIVVSVLFDMANRLKGLSLHHDKRYRLFA